MQDYSSASKEILTSSSPSKSGSLQRCRWFGSTAYHSLSLFIQHDSQISQHTDRSAQDRHTNDISRSLILIILVAKHVQSRLSQLRGNLISRVLGSPENQ